MIIDHDTMNQPGPTDETMPLRVVTELVEKGEIHPDSSVTGRIPRRMSGQFAGPFPVRRVAGLSLRRFAAEAPIEDIVEAVKVLTDDEPEGVVQESSDDTATHALPAVEKLTGRPSDKPIGHRTAHRIQRTFRAAGWDIAVWYGEHTHNFWVMDETGLHEFESVTAIYQGMGWECL